MTVQHRHDGCSRALTCRTCLPDARMAAFPISRTRRRTFISYACGRGLRSATAGYSPPALPPTYCCAWHACLYLHYRTPYHQPTLKGGRTGRAYLLGPTLLAINEIANNRPRRNRTAAGYYQTRLALLPGPCCRAPRTRQHRDAPNTLFIWKNRRVERKKPFTNGRYRGAAAFK